MTPTSSRTSFATALALKCSALEQFVIVLVDRALCRLWAEVSDQARRDGRPIQTADAWIAATALALDVPLVTNNRDDFVGVTGLVMVPE